MYYLQSLTTHPSESVALLIGHTVSLTAAPSHCYCCSMLAMPLLLCSFVERAGALQWVLPACWNLPTRPTNRFPVERVVYLFRHRHYLQIGFKSSSFSIVEFSLGDWLGGVARITTGPLPDYYWGELQMMVMIPNTCYYLLWSFVLLLRLCKLMATNYINILQ